MLCTFVKRSFTALFVEKRRRILWRWLKRACFPNIQKKVIFPLGAGSSPEINK